MRGIPVGRRSKFALAALAAMSVTSSQTLSAEEAEDLPLPTLVAHRPVADELQIPADLGVDADGNATIEVFRERHPNRQVKIEREVTLDQEGNYVNHGTWKMWDEAGTLAAEGQFHMGKRVGVWTRWLGRDSSTTFNEFPYNRFKPPFISQATFDNGDVNGEWMVMDAEEKKVCQISIENNQRHGIATIWLPNGSVLQQSMYKHGLPVGEVIQLNSKTSEPEKTAEYLEGRKIVSRQTFFPRSKQLRTEEMFLEAETVQKTPDDFWNVRFAEFENRGEDLRHGASRSWYSTGQLQFEGSFNHGKQQGRFTYWHANGTKAAEGEFRDDLHQGLWVWWHENGQKATVGNYKNGKLVGKWRWWGADGHLTKQVSYGANGSIANEQADVPQLGQQALPMPEFVR